MAHTPGPWWVDAGPGEGVEVHDGFGRTASVWGDEDTATANARLIAACPDMLALLKDGTNLFLPPPDKIMSQDIAMPTAEAAAEWCRRASELINHVDGSAT
jgi:hypothetical protein